MEVQYKTPLFQKLGLKPNQHIVILNQPIDVLQGIDIDHEVSSKLVKEAGLIIFFAMDKQVLLDKFPDLKLHLTKAGTLWIAWPKKAAKLTSDLDENKVQQIGLDNGLVDVKVISINETWSGLKFVYRLKDR